jgi:hypothetical protein
MVARIPENGASQAGSPDRRITRSPEFMRFLPFFPTRSRGPARSRRSWQPRPRRRSYALPAYLAAGLNSACTNSGHRPVDELHSIENKPDKMHSKTLDLKPGRSKRHSFFDSF